MQSCSQNQLQIPAVPPPTHAVNHPHIGSALSSLLSPHRAGCCGSWCGAVTSHVVDGAKVWVRMGERIAVPCKAEQWGERSLWGCWSRAWGLGLVQPHTNTPHCLPLHNTFSRTC